MKIVLAADPFAYDLKKVLADHLSGRGCVVVDADGGTGTPYYDAAVAALEQLKREAADGAILLCGTGAGMCIVANKISGIRAVAVESVFTAARAKAINNANVITMGAMVVGPVMACAMVDAWLDTRFTEGLENLSEFLHGAAAAVDRIDADNRKNAR